MKAKLIGYISPDRALAMKGDDFATRYGQSIAYYRKGQTDKSLAAIEKLLGEEPENPWLHELKAQVLFESGRVTDSLPVYARALDLMPAAEAALVRTAYGHALLEAGGDHWATALDTLHKALAAEPYQARTHRLLALTYGKMGQEGLSRLHLAEQYALQNKPDMARREALLALSSLPDDNATARLRANDILTHTEKLDEKESSK